MGATYMLARGEQAPDLSLAGLDGRSYSLAEARRTGWVFLAFFDLDCPTSHLSFLYWDRLHEAYAGEGFHFWAVSTDPVEAVTSFVEKSGVTFPILLGNDLGAVGRFGVIATPTHFLVDEEGAIVESYDGFDKAALTDLVTQVAHKRGMPVLSIVGDEAPDFRPACALLRAPSL